MSTLLASALWGLLGAAVNASFRLSTALCEGDAAPTPRARNLAWTQFVIALIAGVVMSAALTPVLMALCRTPCAPVAVTIGLGGTVIARVLRDQASRRIAAVIEALFGSSNPAKSDP